MAAPTLEQDRARGVEGGFASVTVERQPDGPSEIAQARLAGNPGQIVHGWHERQGVSVALKEAGLKPLVGIFSGGQRGVYLQGKEGRQDLAALRENLLAVTEPAIGKGQRNEV